MSHQLLSTNLVIYDRSALLTCHLQCGGVHLIACWPAHFTIFLEHLL